MPIDIDEIKKLSNEEKLRIIDEIWDSIEENWRNEEKLNKESPEITALLEERMEAYEKGKKKSFTWKQMEEKTRQNLDKQRNEKK